MYAELVASRCKHGGWWAGAVWFFDSCRNPMETLLVSDGWKKWQRLTMGPQREMVNGVLLVCSFSDRELTVFLPSSGIESNPQDRVKRFPRLKTVVFDRYAPRVSLGFFRTSWCFLCLETRFVLQNFS